MLCTALSLTAMTLPPALAQATFEAQITKSEPAINYQEDGSLSKQLSMPLYNWSPADGTPRGIVVAIHGLAMHGTVYDGIARALAGQGYSVVSTDLRGYGKLMDDNHSYCHHSKKDCRAKTNYDKSLEDITALTRTLRKQNPSLPIYVMGESLGSSLAIKLAALNPEIVDGLILSAPAVKHQSFLDPYMVADAGMFCANPRAQLDLMPFVKRCASDDQRVVDEMTADPLLRRKMTVYELLQASFTVRKTISYVPEVPADIPVLVIQGSNDRCVKPKAVMALLEKSRSSDQTVKWFHERGHILIETEYVKPDTMDSVVSWINSHATSAAVQSSRETMQNIAIHPAHEVVGVTAHAKIVASEPSEHVED